MINNIVTLEKENIEKLIYEVRGQMVMLASDVAKLYNSEVRIINQVVKRNIKRFPEDFCFQLTKTEFENLKSQFVISSDNKSVHGGNRHLPYAFTEHGVMMLSGLLKSDIAAEVNINIINAFVAMRKYISSNLIQQNYINNLVIEDHEKIKLLETSFQKFEEKKITNETYYNGQIYDAYSKIIEIFKEAKEELIIIDRYADKQILDMVKSLKVKVILVTKKNSLISDLDLEKYNKQYNNLKVIYDNSFHDRYFVLDKRDVYHCGASINHAGSRTFSINKWEDKKVKENFINNLKI